MAYLCKGVLREMRQSKTVAGLVLVVLFQCGCVSLGQKFSATARDEIRLGVTTKSQIIEAFGEPLAKEARKSDSLESTLYHWLYIRATRDERRARELTIETVNDVVNGFLFQSALEEDSTEFDISAAAGLKANEARAGDVLKLLGRPHGEVRLPSNLLSFTFGTMPEAVPPEGAASVYSYFHLFATNEGNLMVRHLKLLLIFFRDDGTVLTVRRVEPVS